MNKALITELQTHFDGRAKLYAAIRAIQCYPQKSSIFFSYVDGWGKKQYVNIPIEPDEILPILQMYVDNIDQDIVNVCEESEKPKAIKVGIENLSELEKYVADYEHRYPDTYTSIAEIEHRLSDDYVSRLGNPDCDGEDFHIEVCSNWKDKIYLFEAVAAYSASHIIFRLKDIVKL